MHATVSQADASRWAVTGSLHTARTGHTATLLPDGRVLVAGGAGNNQAAALASAELYDPSSGTWTVTGSMSAPRLLHTATLLPDGRVLVAGGSNGSGSAPDFGFLDTAEIYDPASGTWRATGSLAAARSAHTATLLASGKVLVAGGASAAMTLATAELYDPAAGTWSATGSLNARRSYHTATRLADGSVLATGGWASIDFDAMLASAERYDPDAGVWRSVPDMDYALANHAATLLVDGRVLVSGGFQGLALTSSGAADVFDAVAGQWSRVANLDASRASHTATLLSDGEVLIAGGYATPTPGASDGDADNAELFDENAAQWRVTASLNTARSSHTATPLRDGRVLVAGGSTVGAANGGAALASAELYDFVAPPGSIGPAYTGAWYDPAQSGHGIFLEILPDHTVFLGWFSFNPAGTEQAWFGGLGSYSGNTATIAVDQPTGGRWIPNFDPKQIVHNAWGTLTLTFADCNHGRVDFASTLGYGSGSMTLTRLTQPEGLTCPQ